MTDEETTTLVVRKSTRDRIAKFGGKDDTFDDIITKLLERVKKR